jgi:hypothetical protein
MRIPTALHDDRRGLADEDRTKGNRRIRIGYLADGAVEPWGSPLFVRGEACELHREGNRANAARELVCEMV